MPKKKPLETLVEDTERFLAEFSEYADRRGLSQSTLTERILGDSGGVKRIHSAAKKQSAKIEAIRKYMAMNPAPRIRKSAAKTAAL